MCLFSCGRNWTTLRQGVRFNPDVLGLFNAIAGMHHHRRSSRLTPFLLLLCLLRMTLGRTTTTRNANGGNDSILFSKTRSSIQIKYPFNLSFCPPMRALCRQSVARMAACISRTRTYRRSRVLRLLGDIFPAAVLWMDNNLGASPCDDWSLRPGLPDTTLMVVVDEAVLFFRYPQFTYVLLCTPYLIPLYGVEVVS